MTFTNIGIGEARSFGGVYLELVPNQRIVRNDRFDDANLPGEMRMTLTLRAVSVGSEVTIGRKGIPDAIPLEACHLGSQETLVLLAQLVQPGIPAG